MTKRTFDIIGSIVGLVCLSPVFLILALLIKITSPGPVMYKATRVGKAGQYFKLYKFRSMVNDADKLGPGVTGNEDQRITPLGRFMRRTKLDELPQLINVLRGEMSLVGPRPEDPRYVAFYTPEQRIVLSVRPGITGPASIQYLHEEAMLVGKDWETYYIENIMPKKLLIDMAYVRNTSLLNDLIIVLRTFLNLFGIKLNMPYIIPDTSLQSNLSTHNAGQD